MCSGKNYYYRYTMTDYVLYTKQDPHLGLFILQTTCRRNQVDTHPLNSPTNPDSKITPHKQIQIIVMSTYRQSPERFLFTVVKKVHCSDKNKKHFYNLLIKFHVPIKGMIRNIQLSKST